jgi:Uma2 family endonuclease
MAVEVTRRRFTADEYLRMAETGILSPTDRVELIEGEIVKVSAQGPPHRAAVARATQTMILTLGGRAQVHAQGPARLNLFNVPEPDLMLLRPRSDFYSSFHPAGADIFLIVEVADTTLNYDRTVKAGIYARLGVREYWIADLNADSLLRHTKPTLGIYREVASFSRGQRLSPELLPDWSIAVDDLLAE